MILRRLCFTIFFFSLLFSSVAQQVHFVYLQTENGQPFYIKKNNVVTSSSAAGYLILPRLAEGDYDITVGFPKKEFPEEKFQISVDDNNKGFLLKNFNEKGWGLFNLQSFAIVMGNNANDEAAPSKELENDPFSRMLANVVKDSTLLEKNVVSTEDNNGVAEETESGPPSQKPDFSGTNEQDVMKNDSSNISRTLLNENNNGVEMIYVDNTPPGSDTIRVFIPSQIVDEAEKQKEIVASKENKTDAVPAEKRPVEALESQDSSLKKMQTEQLLKPVIEKPNEEQPAPGIGSLQNDSEKEAPNKEGKDLTVSDEPLNVIENTTTEPKIKDTAATKDSPKVVTSSFANSDCSDFATNDDFIKLRKKMAGELNNEEMIKSAKKILQSKCFSTEQIKNLSFLFANDQGKYEFFIAAYPFTSDSNLYPTLQGQLRDPFYVNRFRAMLHK